MKIYLDILNHTEDKPTYETFVALGNGTAEVAQITARYAEKWGATPDEMRCFVVSARCYETRMKYCFSAYEYNAEMDSFIINNRRYEHTRNEQIL